MGWGCCSGGCDAIVSGGGEVSRAGLAVEGTLLAGRCLLEVGQTCEQVAPLAFMVASVIRACHKAEVLKDDCRKFAKVVETVEVALCRSLEVRRRRERGGDRRSRGADGNHNNASSLSLLENDDRDRKLRTALSQIQETLDEAMVHVTLCSERGRFGRLFHADDDTQTFLRLSQQLHDACNLLTFEGVVDLHYIAAQAYSQSEALRGLVRSMGGPRAVSQDDSLMEKVLAAIDDPKNKSIQGGGMTAGERLTLQAAADAKKEGSKANEGIAGVQRTLEVHNSHLERIGIGLTLIERQNEDMMIMRKQNEFLANQVHQMHAMLVEQDMKLTRFMELFPVRPDEVRRRQVIDQRGLGYEQIKKNIANTAASPTADDPLSVLCLQALGDMTNLVMLYFIVVNDEIDLCLQGFLWVPDDYKPGKEGLVVDETNLVQVPGRPGGKAYVASNLPVPRKMNSCQYTVAFEEEELRTWCFWKPGDMQLMFPAEVEDRWGENMTKINPGYSRAMTDMTNHPHFQVMLLEEDIYISNDDCSIVYKPVKVHLDDHCVGSLCFIYDLVQDEDRGGPLADEKEPGRGRLWNEEDEAKVEKFVTKFEEELDKLFTR